MSKSKPTTAKSIWSNPDKSQYFLIQDELQLPKGDFIIRTATGRTCRVDFEALKAFEISQEDANFWLKEQLGTVMSQLKAGLKATLFKSPSQQKETNEEQTASESDKEKSATPGLDLLADMTGTPRENMNNNYSAIGQALKVYMTDITSTVADAASGEADRQQSAQERMRAWGNTLREHGIKVADNGDETSNENTE